MNYNLCHIHPNLMFIKRIRTFSKMMSSKGKSQLMWLATKSMLSRDVVSIKLSYCCTQWAAVIIMRGSQLSRRAPHPSQELSDLRMATWSSWVLRIVIMMWRYNLPWNLIFLSNISTNNSERIFSILNNSSLSFLFFPFCSFGIRPSSSATPHSRLQSPRGKRWFGVEKWSWITKRGRKVANFLASVLAWLLFSSSSYNTWLEGQIWWAQPEPSDWSLPPAGHHKGCRTRRKVEHSAGVGQVCMRIGGGAGSGK